jgi:hypothetical protein
MLPTRVDHDELPGAFDMQVSRFLTLTLTAAGLLAFAGSALAQSTTPAAPATQTTPTTPAIGTNAPARAAAVAETEAQRMDRERAERERTERERMERERANTANAATTARRDANGNLIARADRN